jgi:hypothetical protein
MIRDLKSLMAPESAERFRDHFVRKERFHVKSVDPDRAAPLLPWSTINQLIESDTLLPDRLTVVRSGNAISPGLYRRGSSDFSTPRPGAMQALLHQGSSLVMNKIHDLVPSIGHLADAVERELSCKVSTNAYLSFGKASAFKAHYDPHDVVVLQVHGRKFWRCYGVLVAHPIPKSAPMPWNQGNPVWEGMMQPGDVLYLPRGEVHVAELDGDHSVHLTIGLSTRRGLDFVEALLGRAADEDIFRQDIPVTAGGDAIAAHEAALKQALHALIDRTELKGYLDADDRGRNLRPFVNLGVSSPYPADMTVAPALRRRIPLHMETDGDVEVAVDGEKFRLSAPARRVLDFLTAHEDCRFGTIVSALGSQLSEARVQQAVEELAKQSLVGLSSEAAAP